MFKRWTWGKWMFTFTKYAYPIGHIYALEVCELNAKPTGGTVQRLRVEVIL